MKHAIGICRWAVSIVLFITISSSCASTETDGNQLIVIGKEKLPNQTLATTIVDYYQAENKKDWAATYKARGTAYGKLVPFASYKEGMEQGMLDWNLKKIEILDSHQLPNNDFAVKIRFEETFGPKAAEKYYGDVTTHGTETNTNVTVWRQANNSWTCIDGGQRRHVPLNGKMIFD